jgi:hypothetical protein
MSDYVSILEKTRQAFAAVARLEQALLRLPGDPALEMNFRSRKRLAERYQDELFQAAQIEHIDICQYRLIPNTRERYPISNVSKALENFQDLFALVYAALEEGAKDTAHLSRAMRFQTELEFGYSYPGSLGIVLMIPSERDFFSTKFDVSIQAIEQLLTISNTDEVLDLARKLGRAIVNKAYSWSVDNYGADFSVDLVWRKSDGTLSGRHIDRLQMAKLADIIGVTSEETKTPFVERGVLVGIDLPTRWFHFVVPDGDSFKGVLGPDFPTVGTIEVNRRYQAYLVERAITQFATEHTQRRYELERLENDQST